MSTKTIATAATTITALYEKHGVDIWWIDEQDSSGDHLEWHPASNPTIVGREVDEETGEVIDEGQWDLDEADDLLTAAGWSRVEPWEIAPDTRQPTAEIEKC